MADWIGSIGVGLLLIAFVLNLAGRVRAASAAYQGLNFAGAALACWASWLIGYLPFVVLEGSWACAALLALARSEWGRAGSLR